MSWMNETVCPVCGAGGFDPDCDSVDVGVGVLEGNHRGLCRVCAEVAEGDGGWVARVPLREGDRVSALVTWPDGRTVRYAGEFLLLRDGEVYLDSEIGPVVAPAATLEREES